MFEARENFSGALTTVEKGVEKKERGKRNEVEGVSVCGRGGVPELSDHPTGPAGR